MQCAIFYERKLIIIKLTHALKSRIPRSHNKYYYHCIAYRYFGNFPDQIRIINRTWRLGIHSGKCFVCKYTVRDMHFATFTACRIAGVGSFAGV